MLTTCKVETNNSAQDGTALQGAFHDILTGKVAAKTDFGSLQHRDKQLRTAGSMSTAQKGCCQKRCSQQGADSQDIDTDRKGCC